MIRKLLCSILLFGISASYASSSDSIRSYSMEGIYVLSGIKIGKALRQEPFSSTAAVRKELEQRQTLSLKELSAIAPNFYIPDYGSRMTSSIYVRGIGARIDQPAIGLYVDNIPYLNKSNFDFDFHDVQRVEIVRGPQGTLYGRNTMGGIVNIYSLSPFLYQGMRISAGYGNGNTGHVKASWYDKVTPELGLSVSGYWRQTDGFYQNSFNGTACDASQGGGVRMRGEWRTKGGRTSIAGTVSFDGVDQTGYPYALYDPETGTTAAVAYNDPSDYRRSTASAGITVEHQLEQIAISSITSYQWTDDEMNLDQDFTPQSMFTLTQRQKEHAVTQEIVLKSKNRPYEWLVGLFGFYKGLNTSAPVTFKEDGIRTLIEDNVNGNIPPSLGLTFDIREESFPIGSDFRQPTWGLALFHQSSIRDLFTPGLTLSAGLRFDYEHTRLRYLSEADIHYKTNLMSDWEALRTEMPGTEQRAFFEILPRVSLQYAFGAGSNVYLTCARGYKAGGFNVQMFSDILQNAMMQGVLDRLGIHIPALENPYSVADILAYDPESSWNYEAGVHLNLAQGLLQLDASVFYIDCRNQQITVFPAGKTTGRLMRNAGKTRSVGAEGSLLLSPHENVTISASYGFTDARFVRYDDGRNDYRNRVVPYAPRNTVSANVEWRIPTGQRIEAVTIRAGWRGVGRIWWDEANTLSQPFYGLLDATVSLETEHIRLDLWGKNLTQRKYDTFYFVSIGNAFFQRGRPLTWGVTLSFDLQKTKQKHNRP